LVQPEAALGAGVAGAQAGGSMLVHPEVRVAVQPVEPLVQRVQCNSLVPSAFGQATNTAVPLAHQQSRYAFQQAANSTGYKLEYHGGSNPMFPKIAEFAAKNPMAYRAGMGALGATVGGALTPEMPGMPKTKYDGPLSKFAYDPRKYRRQMASGGLADTAVAQRMMRGGHLGSYSDGGRLLKGPGDGMSDDIPAKIGRKQPARLADGEFVVPADVVSGIGNGSTDAGAKRLYQMMDRVRSARTGSKKQGREIKAEKYLPT
jgi:hypothetical protein